jgi:hypothetical protein
MEFFHYYSTPSLRAKLMNLLIKRKIAGESPATLYAIKKAIEGGHSPRRVSQGRFRPLRPVGVPTTLNGASIMWLFLWKTRSGIIPLKA